jgi:hypothetical protein
VRTADVAQKPAFGWLLSLDEAARLGKPRLPARLDALALALKVIGEWVLLIRRGFRPAPKRSQRCQCSPSHRAQRSTRVQPRLLHGRSRSDLAQGTATMLVSTA